MPHSNATIYGAAREGSSPGALLQQLMRAGTGFSGHERNCCFLNLGGHGFADVSPLSGFDFPEDGRGLSLTDWDHDGDLDVWLINRNSPQVRFLRNETNQSGPSLEVRLQGSESNRDAIGARVELTVRDQAGQQRVLVQTVRAGDGFLSQSSKWLHWGLGQAARIEAMTVRWPAGNEETIRGMAIGARYRVVEGSGEAARVPSRPPSIGVRPEPRTIVEAAGGGRVVLESSLPLPHLPYASKTATGATTTLLEQHRGRPLLVVLWATWCQPCLVELAELTRGQSQIEAAGLEVLALNVDPLEPTARREPTNVERVLKRIGYPFQSGFASPESLDRLQVLHDWLFFRTTAIGVPTSLLIDSRGQLAAIYRGSPGLDQLLADVELVERQSDGTITRLPFAGRWATPPRGHRLLWIAARLLELGDAAAVSDYLIEHETLVKSDPDAGPAWFKLGQIAFQSRRFDTALELLDRAAAAMPEQHQIPFLIGTIHELRNDREAANTAFHAAETLDPRAAAQLHLEYAQSLRDQGRPDLAELHVRAFQRLQAARH